MRWNWRLASRLSVITLAVLIVLIVAIVGTKRTQGQDISANASSLQGTDLGNVPAPDFRLTDQYGKSISLSQFKGKPVVVTFLYTHCPDQCPLTAERLHAVMQKLGNNAQNVAVIAVSTDPVGDTTVAALNFSKVHKMEHYWHYLTGTQEELARIWTNYQVYAAPLSAATSTASNSGSVSHTSAVFVIDKSGNERAFFGNDMSTDQLTGDLEVLLRE